MADRRPKRRCVTTKSLVPSAVHYVGYVEDDETPEMIMRKFEELERIRAQAATAKTAKKKEDADAGPSEAANTDAAEEQNADQQQGQPEAAGGQGGGGGAGEDNEESEAVLLDEDLLLEVFKRTSTFNVRSAMQNNEVFFEGDKPARQEDAYVSDSEQEMEDLQYLRGFWSDEDFDMQRTANIKQRRASAAGPKPPKAPREPKEPKEPKQPRGPGERCLQVLVHWAGAF